MISNLYVAATKNQTCNTSNVTFTGTSSSPSKNLIHKFNEAADDNEMPYQVIFLKADGLVQNLQLFCIYLDMIKSFMDIYR